MEFYIIGSPDSIDIDVFVQVDFISSNKTLEHERCKEYDISISKILLDKRPLNSNLIVIKDAIIADCFKGSVDECNNILYYTHSIHNQLYPNPISRSLDRDLDLKVLRVTRCILSYFSRTDLRSTIKGALRKTIFEQLQVLRLINFNNEIIGKKDRKEDIYKVIAFQFGQLFSLLGGYEKYSYTKGGIAKNYPDLKSFLMRRSDLDMNILNEYLSRFISYLEESIHTMEKIKENG